MTVAERVVRAPRALSRRHLVVSALAPLVLAAVLGAVLLVRIPAAPSGASVGYPAPDFTLVTLEGSPVTLAELRGRPVVVNFWASWCVPCLEEFPHLRAALAEHEGTGLEVIGVVYQDGWSSARDYMAHMGATWPAAMDPGARVATSYGVVGPPETVFIDRDGIVRARQFGPFDESSLERHLARILPEGTP